MEDRGPQSTGDDAWVRRGLLAVLGAGLLLRLLYLVELPSYPAFHQPQVDAWHYHQMAQRMAGGDWLLDGTPARMSPGYSYFLAAAYRVLGSGPLLVRLVQMALGLASVALLFGAARVLVGPRWALLPAAVAALYGPFVYYEGHLLAASLGVFLHALLLFVALRWLSRDDVPTWRWLVLGLVWGACVVVRPNALLLLLALGVGLFERGRRPGCWAWARNLVLVGLGGALAIAPLTVRNAVATGEVVAVTSHGGINFYVGNGPGAIGTWTIPDDVPGAHSPTAQFEAFHVAAEQALGRQLAQRDADRYWYGRTVDAVLDDPVRWLGLMARKLHLFWNGRELHNIYDYEFWRDIGLVLGAPLPQFLWVAPFALVGTCWLLLRSRQERFAALFALLSCAAVVLVFVTDRYRLPSVTALLLVGTVVARELLQAVRRRDKLTLYALVPALVVAAAIAVPVQVNKRYHEKYHKLGTAWLKLNQLERAHWAYERSLEARDDFLPTHHKLAELHDRAGLKSEALARWREVELLARQQGDARLRETARGRIAELERAGR